MAYVYQVSFDIHPDQAGELEIGGGLERTLGYLRARLPNEPGYVTSRAMFSVDDREATHIVFQSVWASWEELQAHARSQLLEDQTLHEFGMHVDAAALKHASYAEVGEDTAASYA